MKPPEPSEGPDEPADDPLREEQARWKRVEAAKTPEELQAALRRPKRPPRLRAVLRSALFPLIVIGVLASQAAGLRGAREIEPLGPPVNFEAELETPSISPLSVGPVLAVPPASVVAVVSARGGEPVPVTPLGEGAREPTWRPDGDALLVDASTGFVELPADGARTLQWSRRRALGYRGGSPSYSPDGARIAFVAVLADIVIGDLQGRRPRLVARLIEGAEPLALDWSRRNELAVAASGPIFVVTPDGRVVREVLAALPSAMTPAWSPDGRRIAYTQGNPSPGDGFMRVAITEPSSRTPPGERVGPPGSTTAWPAWSPDGRSLAYARFVDGTWDLYVYEFATKRQRRLTHGPGDEVDPAWSPDGRQIAFVASGL